MARQARAKVGQANKVMYNNVRHGITTAGTATTTTNNNRTGTENKLQAITVTQRTNNHVNHRHPPNNVTYTPRGAPINCSHNATTITAGRQGGIRQGGGNCISGNHLPTITPPTNRRFQVTHATKMCNGISPAAAAAAALCARVKRARQNATNHPQQTVNVNQSSRRVVRWV